MQNNWLNITIIALCIIIIILLSISQIHKIFQWFFKAHHFPKLGNSTQIRIVHQLQEACSQMSENKTGALITLELNTPLEHLRTDGHILDANISSSLIISIFAKGSPLHDGALIIQKSKIKYAGTFYKISESSISNRFGARHRAAVGISEQSDSLTIVVSEETGDISFCRHGKIKKISIIQFQEKLFEFLKAK